jgi:hypothetical protein
MNRRRLILTLWVVIFAFLIPSASYAYIDPATTTYIIQVFAAVVITLGVSLSVFIYKFRMIFVSAKTRFYQFLAKISKSRRIKDKIAGQTRSDAGGDIPPRPGYGKAEILWGSHKIMSTAEDMSSIVISPEYPPPTINGRIRYLLKYNRNFRLRLLMSALLSFAITFTFIIFGIFELTISNSDSLPFSVSEIFKGTMIIGLSAFVAMTVILCIFRGRIFDIFISFLLAFLIGGYLQGNFMNVGIGELNGDGIVWDQYYKQVIINVIIWIAIFIFIFALRYFSKKTWQALVMIIPALLIVMQGVALVSIYPVDPTSFGKDVTKGIEKVVTYNGLTELSEENNVVVFILDRFDQRYLESVVEEEPNFFDPLEGFTMYTQNVGAYEQTFPAMPFMLTGEYFYGDIPAEEYTYEAYQNAELFDEMHDAGMRVNLYTTAGTAFLNIADLEGISDNITPIKIHYDRANALKKLLRLSAFRYSPLAMKASLYISTEDFDKVKRAEVGEDQPYWSDDPEFYRRILDDPLTVSDKYKGTFSLYHFQGPHLPYTMNRNAEYDPDGKLTRNDQTMGCFHIIYEYINQLKELGIYKDTTIIITADHGYSANHDGINSKPNYVLTGPEISALIVKPAGSDTTSLKQNDAEVAQLDFRASIMKAAGLEYAKYGTPYDEATMLRGTSRIHFHRSQETINGHWAWLRELEQWNVNGDARKFSNWELIEKSPIEYWHNVMPK